MGAVASFVGDAVGDVVEVVGDVAQDVVQVAGDAVQDVGQTLESTIQGALNDPIGTMATVATAVYAPYMLPVVSAGRVVANGGDLDDALKSAAITYAAQGVGDYMGGQTDAAINYGTDLGSQQTAMLAAQDVGMGMGTMAGGAASAAAGAGTGAALSGGDVGQAIIGGLAGYGTRLGMNLATNAIGQVVNEAGDVIANSFDELKSMFGDEYGDQPGDFPLNAEELAAADLELGGIPYPGMLGDQPGDYDTTPEEHAASERILAGLPGLDQVMGDQPGDFPTTAKDLALEDELMGQTGDQPGDYDTAGSYGDPTAEGVQDATRELLENNALVSAGGVPLDYADQPEDYDTTEEERLASEEILANMPGSNIEGYDPQALIDYSKNMFKNSLLKSIFGKTPNTGVRTPNKLVSGLSPFGGTDEENLDTDSAVVAPSATSDLGLFNATGNMSWAPQTKIGGLGAAGKYINQEQDTYYMDPVQAKREQDMKNRESGFGWDIGDSEMQDQSSGFYEYTPEDFSYQSYFAEGGSIPGHNPEFFSEGGMGNRYVRGDGDGTSDSVPAMLASGEFVIPADVVSGLGNGDNDAGAHVLDEFMKAIRAHKRAADPSELPEDSKGPLAYLQEALTKARK